MSNKNKLGGKRTEPIQRKEMHTVTLPLVPPAQKFSVIITYDPATKQASLVPVDTAVGAPVQDLLQALLMVRDQLLMEAGGRAARKASPETPPEEGNGHVVPATKRTGG